METPALHSNSPVNLPINSKVQEKITINMPEDVKPTSNRCKEIVLAVLAIFGVIFSLGLGLISQNLRDIIARGFNPNHKPEVEKEDIENPAITENPNHPPSIENQANSQSNLSPKAGSVKKTKAPEADNPPVKLERQTKEEVLNAITENYYSVFFCYADGKGVCYQENTYSNKVGFFNSDKNIAIQSLGSDSHIKNKHKENESRYNQHIEVLKSLNIDVSDFPSILAFSHGPGCLTNGEAGLAFVYDRDVDVYEKAMKGARPTYSEEAGKKFDELDGYTKRKRALQTLKFQTGRISEEVEELYIKKLIEINYEDLLQQTPIENIEYLGKKSGFTMFKIKNTTTEHLIYTIGYTEESIKKESKQYYKFGFSTSKFDQLEDMPNQYVQKELYRTHSEYGYPADDQSKALSPERLEEPAKQLVDYIIQTGYSAFSLDDIVVKFDDSKVFLISDYSTHSENPSKQQIVSALSKLVEVFEAEKYKNVRDAIEAAAQAKGYIDPSFKLLNALFETRAMNNNEHDLLESNGLREGEVDYDDYYGDDVVNSTSTNKKQRSMYIDPALLRSI